MPIFFVTSNRVNLMSAYLFIKSKFAVAVYVYGLSIEIDIYLKRGFFAISRIVNDGFHVLAPKVMQTAKPAKYSSECPII